MPSSARCLVLVPGPNIVRHREGAMGAPALGIFTPIQRLSEGHCLAWKHSIVLPEGPSMQRSNERTHPRQIAGDHNPRRWFTMNTDTVREPAPVHETRGRGANRTSPAAADAALEFGRFRMLLRQRQLLDNEVPVELGTRLRSASGPLGGRRVAPLKRGAPQPGVAGRRGVGSKPQGSDLGVAQGARRGARCHPHRSRPWLPLHRRAPLHFRAGRLSMFHASKAAFWPNSVSQNCLQALRRSFVVAEPPD